MKMRNIRIFSDAKMDEYYGKRKIDVNKAFKTTDDHYYLQRPKDVLHIGNNLINTLHEGTLNGRDPELIIEIPLEEFNLKMKETIYNMELNCYWEN